MNRKTDNTEVVKMRIDSDVKSEIERIAKIEDRSFAAQCGRALREWLTLYSKRKNKALDRLENK